jgi:hypothetical protein
MASIYVPNFRPRKSAPQLLQLLREKTSGFPTMPSKSIANLSGEKKMQSQANEIGAPETRILLN